MAQQSIRSQYIIETELAIICGENSKPYAERVKLVHRLPSNLAPEQLELCRAFLESPLAGQPLPDLEFNGLKNELVFALLRQREGLTELAELLVRMSRAPDTDATWRDYCVHTRRRFAPRAAAVAAIRLSASLCSRLHFLGKCYPRIHDARSREAMAEALWEALKTQRRSRAAGSAARQLMTLGRSFPNFPPDKVSAASLEVLLDPASSDETRTALLQVCGTLGERGALPTARAIAGRSSTPVLRASAIAAVGMLGDASDLPLLKHLAASGDYTVPAAVQDTPSYDADGNLLTYDGWSYAWNGENRMVETCKGNDRLTFKYDYMGRRVEKCVYSNTTLTSKTLFVYDGFKCVEELDGMNGDALSMLHTWQPFDVGLDVILATTDGGGTSFFLFDAQKDAMQKTHTNQNLMISSNYKPTGGNIGLNEEYIGFSSEFYDYVLELVYYNYRYYIPDFGRWIKRDSSEIHDYLNLYRFVNNDYINFYDNLGLHGVPGLGLSPSLPSNPSQEFTSTLNRITQLQIQYARYMQCQKENEERKKKNLCPIRCPQFPNTPSELDCNCVCQELYQGVHSALIAPCTENCKNFKPLIGLVPKKEWWKFW